MASTRSAAFAAPHRVGHRVHGDAANVGPTPHPPFAARFADRHLNMVRVSDHANRRPTRAWQAPNFAGRKRDLRPLPFAGVHDGVHAGRAAQLPAPTRLHFDAVNLGPGRNLLEWHAVADIRLDFKTAFDFVANLETFRREDVSLLTVDIVQQGDPSRTVGIVFNEGDAGGNPVLFAVEIDDAIN